MSLWKFCKLTELQTHKQNKDLIYRRQYYLEKILSGKGTIIAGFFFFARQNGRVWRTRRRVDGKNFVRHVPKKSHNIIVKAYLLRYYVKHLRKLDYIAHFQICLTSKSKWKFTINLFLFYLSFSHVMYSIPRKRSSQPNRQTDRYMTSEDGLQVLTEVIKSLSTLRHVWSLWMDNFAQVGFNLTFAPGRFIVRIVSFVYGRFSFFSRIFKEWGGIGLAQPYFGLTARGWKQFDDNDIT